MRGKRWFQVVRKTSFERPWQMETAEGMRWAILFCLTVYTLFCVASAYADHPGWSQVNKDGFVSGFGPTTGTDLFVFDGKLFAHNDNGFFLMENPSRKKWTKLSPPIPPAGPGATPEGVRVLGSC